MTKLTAAAAAALLLSSCGPKTLTLPEQPVDRAATCGVVAAAEARAATNDIKQTLPFTGRGRILHFALLAGAEGEEYSQETATAVTKRMPELQEQITEGKWQELAPACRAAFPAAYVEEATLPEDRFTAQLGCDELAKYLTNALGGQEGEYPTQLSRYRDLRRTLDPQLAVGLRSRAGADLGAQQEERARALGAIVKLGSPAALMQQCVEQFG